MNSRAISAEPEYECKELLNKAIRKMIADGFIVFISGMARGVDSAGQSGALEAEQYASKKLLEVREKLGIKY